MAQLVGFLIVMALVLGALFSVGGGVMHALPFELALIVGSALGTLLVANTPEVSRKAIGAFTKVIGGPKWKQGDYLGLLSLLYALTREARQGGIVAIETDIEDPHASPHFQKHPRILSDSDARDLICDTFRLMALDLSDPARAEESMRRTIAARTDRQFRVVSALHTVADALPALGIVAAVIGIIRAMAVIDQSPTVLGGMIAAALLGTFLGVFLAYGVVSPVANRLGQIVEEEAEFLETIQTVLSAFGRGLPARTCVEIGRTAVPADLQPATETVSHALQAERFGAAQTRARAA